MRSPALTASLLLGVLPPVAPAARVSEDLRGAVAAGVVAARAGGEGQVACVKEATEVFKNGWGVSETTESKASQFCQDAQSDRWPAGDCLAKSFAQYAQVYGSSSTSAQKAADFCTNGKTWDLGDCLEQAFGTSQNVFGKSTNAIDKAASLCQGASHSGAGTCLRDMLAFGGKGSKSFQKALDVCKTGISASTSGWSRRVACVKEAADVFKMGWGVSETTEAKAFQFCQDAQSDQWSAGDCIAKSFAQYAQVYGSSGTSAPQKAADFCTNGKTGDLGDCLEQAFDTSQNVYGKSTNAIDKAASFCQGASHSGAGTCLRDMLAFGGKGSKSFQKALDDCKEGIRAPTSDWSRRVACVKEAAEVFKKGWGVSETTEAKAFQFCQDAQSDRWPAGDCLAKSFAQYAQVYGSSGTSSPQKAADFCTNGKMWGLSDCLEQAFDTSQEVYGKSTTAIDKATSLCQGASHVGVGTCLRDMFAVNAHQYGKSSTSFEKAIRDCKEA